VSCASSRETLIVLIGPAAYSGMYRPRACIRKVYFDSLYKALADATLGQFWLVFVEGKELEESSAGEREEWRGLIRETKARYRAVAP
jgi:hypothetical protein